jgi:hypothetical protein
MVVIAAYGSFFKVSLTPSSDTRGIFADALRI